MKPRFAQPGLVQSCYDPVPLCESNYAPIETQFSLDMDRSGNFEIDNNLNRSR
jgi:hypothetical protein